MKICTFNVNSIRARKDLILNWLAHRDHDLDILLFQEIKTLEENFPVDDFKSLGFSCITFGQKAYNGVSICSKIPLDDFQIGFPSQQWNDQKRLISAVVDGITIINVYAPHGGLPGTEKYLYKQEWYHAFQDYLNTHYSPSSPILVAGDFNVARQDLDVFSPEQLKGTIGTLPEERAVFENILSWGLVDVFRHKNHDKKQFTWWDYQTAAIWRDEGMRIDHILCTKPLLSRIQSIEVDLWPRRRRTPTPSDHAPVIATL